MKISSIQFQIRDNETKDERLKRMAEKISLCQGSQVIVLPEIWNTGYFNFDRYEVESESLEGPTMFLMSQKAREVQAYLMAGSFVENVNGQLFNTSVLFDPQGEILATYRKIHLFGFGSEETRILTPGSKAVTVDTELGRFGLATCYDLRFPELFRKMLDQNVDFFLISSAWPYPRLDHWRMLNQVRALENECYLISANCAGINRGKQYLGHSAMVDPWGVIIAGAGDEEAVISADISAQEVKRIRQAFPPVQDRVAFS